MAARERLHVARLDSKNRVLNFRIGDYVMNVSVKQYRNRMINELRLAYPNEPLVQEYIEESEHQEGEAYWLEFESIADMITDFQLYKESCDDSE
jgi:hypothetical protein